MTTAIIKTDLVPEFVERREKFKTTTGNLFSEQKLAGYVVFSYGHHWPICVYVEGVGWIAHMEKVSLTTTNHTRLALQNIKVSKWLPKGDIESLINEPSFTAWVVQRIKQRITPAGVESSA